jgi:hypothetical protein
MPSGMLKYSFPDYLKNITGNNPFKFNKMNDDKFNNGMTKIYSQLMAFLRHGFEVVLTNKDHNLEEEIEKKIISCYEFFRVPSVDMITSFLPIFTASESVLKPYQNTKDKIRGLTFGHLLWLNYCYLRGKDGGIHQTYYHFGPINEDHESSIPILYQLAIYGIFSTGGQTACNNNPNCTLPFQRSYISGFIIKFWNDDREESVKTALDSFWNGLDKSFLYINLDLSGQKYLYLFCEGMDKPVLLLVDQSNLNELKKYTFESRQIIAPHVGVVTYEDLSKTNSYFTNMYPLVKLDHLDNIYSETQEQPMASKIHFLVYFTIWSKNLDGNEAKTVDKLLLEYLKKNQNIRDIQYQKLKDNGEEFIDLTNRNEMKKKLDLAHFNIIPEELYVKVMEKISKTSLNKKQAYGGKPTSVTKAKLIQICRKHKIQYSHKTKQELIVMLRQSPRILKKEKMVL